MQLGHAAVRVLLAVRQMDPRRQVQLQVGPDRVQPDLSVVFSGQSVIAAHGQHLEKKKEKKTFSLKKKKQLSFPTATLFSHEIERRRRRFLVTRVRAVRPTCDECDETTSAIGQVVVVVTITPCVWYENIPFLSPPSDGGGESRVGERVGFVPADKIL